MISGIKMCINKLACIKLDSHKILMFRQDKIQWLLQTSIQQVWSWSIYKFATWFRMVEPSRIKAKIYCTVYCVQKSLGPICINIMFFDVSYSRIRKSSRWSVWTASCTLLAFIREKNTIKAKYIRRWGLFVVLQFFTTFHQTMDYSFRFAADKQWIGFY